MSLFAIGDLHLHFQSELKAPGQLQEAVWKNHDVKFRQNCEKLIKPNDTLVLVGDHSWGKKLPECEKDLEYISALHGRKILLRGNHDMFWDAKKTDELNKQYAGKLFFLQNNYASYQDYAIVGTKGYTFEGPFYMRGKKHIPKQDDYISTVMEEVATDQDYICGKHNWRNLLKQQDWRYMYHTFRRGHRNGTKSNIGYFASYRKIGQVNRWLISKPLLN